MVRSIRCMLHHDNWAEVAWEGPPRLDRTRRSMYWDVLVIPHLKDYHWLIMEPTAREICYRTRVCFIS